MEKSHMDPIARAEVSGAQPMTAGYASQLTDTSGDGTQLDSKLSASANDATVSGAIPKINSIANNIPDDKDKPVIDNGKKKSNKVQKKYNIIVPKELWSQEMTDLYQEQRELLNKWKTSKDREILKKTRRLGLQFKNLLNELREKIVLSDNFEEIQELARIAKEKADREKAERIRIDNERHCMNKAKLEVMGPEFIKRFVDRKFKCSSFIRNSDQFIEFVKRYGLNSLDPKVIPKLVERMKASGDGHLLGLAESAQRSRFMSYRNRSRRSSQRRNRSPGRRSQSPRRSRSRRSRSPRRSCSYRRSRSPRRSCSYRRSRSPRRSCSYRRSRSPRRSSCSRRSRSPRRSCSYRRSRSPGRRSRSRSDSKSPMRSRYSKFLRDSRSPRRLSRSRTRSRSRERSCSRSNKPPKKTTHGFGPVNKARSPSSWVKFPFVQERTGVVGPTLPDNLDELKVEPNSSINPDNISLQSGDPNSVSNVSFNEESSFISSGPKDILPIVPSTFVKPSCGRLPSLMADIAQLQTSVKNSSKPVSAPQPASSSKPASVSKPVSAQATDDSSASKKKVADGKPSYEKCSPNVDCPDTLTRQVDISTSLTKKTKSRDNFPVLDDTRGKDDPDPNSSLEIEAKENSKHNIKSKNRTEHMSLRVNSVSFEWQGSYDEYSDMCAGSEAAFDPPGYDEQADPSGGMNYPGSSSFDYMYAPNYSAPYGGYHGGPNNYLTRMPFSVPRMPFNGPPMHFNGPPGPFNGPRGPFNGPRGPFNGPRWTFTNMQMTHYPGPSMPYPGTMMPYPYAQSFYPDAEASSSKESSVRSKHRSRKSSGDQDKHQSSGHKKSHRHSPKQKDRSSHRSKHSKK